MKMATTEMSAQLIDSKLPKSSPLKGGAKPANVTRPTLQRGSSSMTSPLSPGSAALVLSNMRNSASPRPSVPVSPKHEAMRTDIPGCDQSKDHNKAIMSFDAHLKSIITTALMGDGDKKPTDREDVKKSSSGGSAEAENLTFKKHLSHDNQQSRDAGMLSSKQPKHQPDKAAARHVPVTMPFKDTGANKKPSVRVSIPLSSVHSEEKPGSKLKAPSHVMCEGYSPISRPSSSSSTESAESVKNLEQGAHISRTKHASCISPAASIVHDMQPPAKSVSVAPMVTAKMEDKGVSMASLLHRTAPPPHVLRMYSSYAAMLRFSGAAPGTLPMLNSFNMPNMPNMPMPMYSFGGLNGVSKLPEQPLHVKTPVQHPQSLAAGLDKPKRTRRKRCNPNAATDVVTSKKQTSTVPSVTAAVSHLLSHALVSAACDTSVTSVTSATMCSPYTTASDMRRDPGLFYGEFV